MTISYIPSELIQAILLQVDGPKHKDFLASCTLVCKRWLPLARSLLFTDITLRVGKSEEVQFCELARLDPNIALSIRDVHLRALNQPDPVPLSHLQEILCVLPRLKSLQIMRTFPVTEDEHHTEKTTHTLAKLSLAFAAGDSGWVPFLKFSPIPGSPHIAVGAIRADCTPSSPCYLSVLLGARESQPPQ
ncbi:hypothetical protein BDW22DRAFT_1252711 [Trametopsis cervina]|nr:hypothetical protein BDW22DRAFT_1252711 [Trametopsis cervina]